MDPANTPLSRFFTSKRVISITMATLLLGIAIVVVIGTVLPSSHKPPLRTIQGCYGETFTPQVGDLITFQDFDLYAEGTAQEPTWKQGLSQDKMGHYGGVEYHFLLLDKNGHALKRLKHVPSPPAMETNFAVGENAYVLENGSEYLSFLIYTVALTPMPMMQSDDPSCVN